MAWRHPLEARKCKEIDTLVKNLPAMQETQARSLGQEDPLEEGMATHSGILAWEIPWTEEPGVLQSMGSQSPARMSWTCLICLSFIKSSTLCKGLSPLSSLIKVHKMLG